jgi:hypothetical protein
MRLLAGLLRWSRRFAVLIAVAAMLALNVATLAMPAAAGFATGLLARAGVHVAVAPRAEVEAARRATRDLARAARAAKRSVGRRVARGALRNVGAVAAESLPYLGVAAIVGFTALELKDACDTMKELEALEAELEALAPSEAASSPETTPDAAEVCGLEVPSREVLVERAAEAPREVWEEAGKLAENGLPDASIPWADYRARLGGWFCGFDLNPFCER